MGKKYLVENIIPYIQSPYELKGQKDAVSIDNIKPVHEANETSLIFIGSTDFDGQKFSKETKARVIICSNKLIIDEELLKTKCFICVSNPKLIFARIVRNLFNRYKITSGIDKTAIIHKDAKIAKNVYIGPYTVIGNCIIKENTIIHGHCYIYDNVVLGKDVIILNDSVIGVEGVGYVQNEKGEHENFPQIGTVILEDGVHIGANTVVDRGSLGDTVIKKNTKIGNGVQIGHNVTIGENTIITAHSVIAGSMTVGNNCYIGPNSSTNGHLQIGNRTFVGTGSVVTENIPDGERWFGIPAKPIQEFNKREKQLQKLTENS